jgi:hypothetical protein
MQWNFAGPGEFCRVRQVCSWGRQHKTFIIKRKPKYLNKALLKTQRHHRINFRRTSSRDVADKKRSRSQQSNDGTKGHRVCCPDTVKQIPH